MEGDGRLVLRRAGKPVSAASGFPAGRTPAVLLADPKYPANLGAVLRACACFGVPQLWVTGDRAARLDPAARERIPREERMRGYDVVVARCDRPFAHFPRATPVCVEVLPGAESLFAFEPPPDPLYVFGPEDGSVPKAWRGLCRRFVAIPTDHCCNLSAAVHLVLLWHRFRTRPEARLEETLRQECRGPAAGAPSPRLFPPGTRPVASATGDSPGHQGATS